MALSGGGKEWHGSPTLCPADQQEPLEEYLAYHFPASRLEQVDFGRLCYHLPSTTDGRPVKMSEIFACIQKAVTRPETRVG